MEPTIGKQTGQEVKQVGLPPLIGFLAAGFVLNMFGVESSEVYDVMREKYDQAVLGIASLFVTKSFVINPRLGSN